jgi:hypothetical protein
MPPELTDQQLNDLEKMCNEQNAQVHLTLISNIRQARAERDTYMADHARLNRLINARLTLFASVERVGDGINYDDLQEWQVQRHRNGNTTLLSVANDAREAIDKLDPKDA